MKKLTTEEFIIRAKKVHGDNYDYSEVVYLGIKSKVKIKCLICGNIFWQTPNSHIGKCVGCTLCGYKKASNKQIRKLSNVILEANKIHNFKYDYSLIFSRTYKGLKQKVPIVCPIHGIFKQQLNWHISGKNGCPECGGNIKLETSEFIERSKKVHGDKYVYDDIVYKNEKTKVQIFCKLHNSFFYQKPFAHVRLKQGCPKCNESRGEKGIRLFLENNNIEYIKEYIIKDLGNYRFDFYLPNYNLIIEFDGKQHFQPVEFFGGLVALRKTKYNDYIKTMYCLNNAINIIRIKYLDIDKIDYILSSLKF